MSPATLITVLLALTAFAFYLGKRRSLGVAARAGGIRRLHSLPSYYGTLTALWCGVPALIVLGLWLAFETTIITWFVVAELPDEVRGLPEAQLGLVINDIRNLVSGNIVAAEVNPAMTGAAERYARLQGISAAALAVVAISLALAGVGKGWRLIRPGLRARNHVERAGMVFLVASSMVAIFTTIGIVLSVIFEAMRFFEQVPFSAFMFGLEWSPQTAIRDDQVGSSGAFGAVPLFAGTLLISAIAMMIAAPIGLFAAVYLAEYADRRVRAVAKPLLEILAGIPTVVYGFFAALTVAPVIRGYGGALGLDVSSESALAAGFVMGLMLIPFISSLSDDVINAVPESLRDGSYGLGATKSETIRQVVLPAALPGIVGGLLLAISRAIGETMIVVMAAD